MGKLYVALMALGVVTLAACNNSDETSEAAVKSANEVLRRSTMPAVAKKNNCTACHAVDKKVVGPAWKDVAAKYKDDATAWDRVATKIKNGGSGAWGAMPMPANSKVSDDDMKEIIAFIKGL